MSSSDCCFYTCRPLSNLTPSAHSGVETRIGTATSEGLSSFQEYTTNRPRGWGGGAGGKWRRGVARTPASFSLTSGGASCFLQPRTHNEDPYWDQNLRPIRGHEFEQAPGVGDGQGSWACCSPWGLKELDTTEQMNRTEALKPPSSSRLSHSASPEREDDEHGVGPKGADDTGQVS